MPQKITSASMEHDINRAFRYLMDVSVEDVEVRRAPTKHYVYVVYVSWSDGTVSIVYRRYEDFLLLEKILWQTIGNKKIHDSQLDIPQLPGKIILGRNNVQKVALRRQGVLYDYCKVLLSLPRAVLDASRAARFFEPTDLDIRATLKRPTMEEKQRGDKVHEISDPILEEKYIAIADYPKDGDDQLDLKAGDSLQTFVRDEAGWWLVLNSEGKYGWVPCSYLEKVDGTEEETVTKMPPGKTEKYMSLDNYEAQYPDEVNLQKGTVIEVVEKTVDGWWLVRTANKEGRAPAINLAKADSLKVRNALEKATMPDNTINYQDLNFDSVSDDLSLNLRMFAVDIDDDNDEYVDVWLDPSLRKKIQEVQKKDAHQDNISKNIETILSLKKKTSVPPPRKRSIKRKIASRQDANEGDSNLQEAFISDPGNESSLARLEENQDLSLDDPVSTHVDESELHDYYNVSPFQKKQSKKERPKFEARSMFKAGDSGETDLVEGEVVVTLEKTGTGWWLVQSRSGVGWVPSHFLKPLNRDPNAVQEKFTSEQEISIEMITPQVPSHKKEKVKAKGHIANRYLQGSTSEPEPGVTSYEEQEQASPKRTKPGVPPKPTTSPKPTEPTSSKPVKPIPARKPDISSRKPAPETGDTSQTSPKSVKNLRAFFNK